MIGNHEYNGIGNKNLIEKELLVLLNFWVNDYFLNQDMFIIMKVNKEMVQLQVQKLKHMLMMKLIVLYKAMLKMNGWN